MPAHQPVYDNEREPKNAGGGTMGTRERRWTLTVATCGVLVLAPTAGVVAAQRKTGTVAVSRTAPAFQAYEAGLRDGTRQGELDGRSGRDGNLERHETYRTADHGYTRSWGDRDAYRAEFRRGFAVGYRQGFDRVRGHENRQSTRDDQRDDRERRWGRGYRDPAVARGYSDGYDEGLDDGRDRDRYDPARHGDYREGDEGYKREYGARDTYKSNYRAGFRQGYEDGYREGNRR